MQFEVRSKTGVTLIEMLAVIVVIGILAGLILPAVQDARRRSHEAKAISEVNQLKAAWRAYVSTYMNDERVASLPSGTEMTPDMVRILMGQDASANPDSIRFMDFPTDAEARGFVDPWGELYKVSIGELDWKTKTWSYATRVYCSNRDPL